MGEREDILRRALERIREGRWAVDTNYRNVREAARAALREAAACPPDDAQQRLDQIDKILSYALREDTSDDDGWCEVYRARDIARGEAAS
jgi:hypothetical protein